MNLPNSVLCHTGGQQRKKKKGTEKRTEKKIEYEGDLISNVIVTLSTFPEGLAMGLEDLEIRGQMETRQNTALLKSTRIQNPGDLRRFAVTQTPEKDYPQALVKEGGRGLASIEDSVDTSIQRLKDYREKHERGLITAIRNDTVNTIDDRMTTTKQKWEKKQLYGRFKRLINNISYQKTWTWQRKWNLKREAESLLITAQDNAIRTNHIKARIDKTQQSSKCKLFGDRDETINHIISECSKLAQNEYKAKHDWVGKVIHREMCKKFKFDHTNKWYMHNPASVQENDTQKLLWNFNIQTDHLIPARRPDFIIIN